MGKASFNLFKNIKGTRQAAHAVTKNSGFGAKLTA